MRSFFRWMGWLLKRLGAIASYVLFLSIYAILPIISLYGEGNKDTGTWWTVVSLLQILGFFLIAAVVALRSERVVNRVMAFACVTCFIVGVIGYYALAYQFFGLRIDGKPVLKPSPKDCLYFSIITWTTLGYGDITPTDASKFVAASEALVGYICMALLIAIIVKVLDRRV